MSSDLAKAFIAALPDGRRPFATNDSPIILRVPEKAREVGDLTVYDDEIELTVCVGQLDHVHFEAFCETGDQPERNRKAIENALQWIEDVLADRIRFQNQFHKGRLVMGSSWQIDRPRTPIWAPSTEEYREYTWSGQKLQKRLVRRDR